MSAATLLPTVPGCVEGVVGIDPDRLQCSQCGAVEAPARLVLMTTRFHQGWDGRWCRSCRLAKGCTCDHCAWERRTYGKAAA